MSSIGVLEAAADAFCAESIQELTAAEALAVLARLEVVQRRLSAHGLGLVPMVMAQASPVELGGTSHADVLSRRLHISKGAARRRIGDAEQLAPRQALTGEVLAPQLPNVAEALRRGDIGDEHVRIIRSFFDRLPVVVDEPTHEAAEKQLAQRQRTVAYWRLPAVRKGQRDDLSRTCPRFPVPPIAGLSRGHRVAKCNPVLAIDPGRSGIRINIGLLSQWVVLG